MSATTDSAGIPPIVAQGWEALGLRGEIVEIDDMSANVSTNYVYRITISTGHEFIVKTSSYGSYVHFRQDHQLIKMWIRRLQGTRFAQFLAPMVLKGNDVFTFSQDDTWLVFYQKAPFYDFLPRVLDDAQIEALGREMARFHRASFSAAQSLHPSWKTLGSDVAALYDAIGNPHWRQERGLDTAAGRELRRQCDVLLENATNLGYQRFSKIPILVDWNIGNFSVGLEESGFKFFSRWDYDWFRIDSRMLDFYFCARVVRAEGDMTVFTYSTEPFFEPRFERFLRAYHSVYPLADNEVLFMKEAYRFFLLNYVMRSGEHFFRPSYCERLQREALQEYLPVLDRVDFAPLLKCLH